VYETWGYGKSTNKETAVANAMFNCNYTGALRFGGRVAEEWVCGAVHTRHRGGVRRR
jgi:hypothetical protein